MSPIPDPNYSGTRSRKTPEERQADDLERFNKARATRGLRALTQYEREARDEMVLAYGDLGPGTERDRITTQLAKLDGTIEETPAPMPQELREQIARIGRGRAPRPDTAEANPCPF